MNVLRIDSSPRGAASNSRALTDYLVQSLAPARLTRRDVAAEPFPALAPQDLVALHGSRREDRKSLEHHMALSDRLIGELMAADTLVVGIAMHNFSIPAALKRWIDYVCRAGLTFRYTDTGPEGLTPIRSAWLMVASGGTPVGGDMDFATGYMTHICRFLGIDTVHVVDASGSKRTPEAVLRDGRAQIDALVAHNPQPQEA